ncbi:TetR/AcrR family transcriptional regulator [Dietzia aerolata]|uniref:TetR/AcrR family transcriptional regulator n=1 Tax=Dietzia aerolata TaxID=595984 RepID=UPI00362E5183
MERESPTPEQTSAPEAAARPTGRDEIRSAVLREARRLFSERGPQVPLRDIADAAGVNLGLIHRHIGRKEALITAVMQDAVRFGAARLENTDDAGEAVRGMLLGASSHPEISRLLAWLALDRDAAFPPMVDPSLRPAAELRRMNDPRRRATSNCCWCSRPSTGGPSCAERCSTRSTSPSPNVPASTNVWPTSWPGWSPVGPTTRAPDLPAGNDPHLHRSCVRCHDTG